MEVLKLDAGRVIAENSQLHVQLIQQAEQYDTREKDHYKHVKRLEDREAELSYWKHQAIDRFQKVDKENAELRKRVEQLLRLAEKRSQGVGTHLHGACLSIPAAFSLRDADCIYTQMITR